MGIHFTLIYAIFSAGLWLYVNKDPFSRLSCLAGAPSFDVYQVLPLPSLYQSASENEGKKTWWSVTCFSPTGPNTIPWPSLSNPSPWPEHSPVWIFNLSDSTAQGLLYRMQSSLPHQCRDTELKSLDSAPQGCCNEFGASSEHLNFLCVSLHHRGMWHASRIDKSHCLNILMNIEIVLTF